jgi:hypothetical protein
VRSAPSGVLPCSHTADAACLRTALRLCSGWGACHAESTLDGVKGLSPDEHYHCGWPRLASLPHPLILRTRPPRPQDLGSPLSKAPSNSGISSLLQLLVNRAFSFSSAHSSFLPGASTLWQGTDGVKFSERHRGSWPSPRTGREARCSRCPVSPADVSEAETEAAGNHARWVPASVRRLLGIG